MATEVLEVFIVIQGTTLAGVGGRHAMHDQAWIWVPNQQLANPLEPVIQLETERPIVNGSSV